MEIRFDRPTCQGNAQCALAGPDVYPLDDDGYCALEPVTEVPAGLEAQAESGADACPVQALSIVE